MRLFYRDIQEVVDHDGSRTGDRDIRNDGVPRLLRTAAGNRSGGGGGRVSECVSRVHRASAGGFSGKCGRAGVVSAVRGQPMHGHHSHAHAASLGRADGRGTGGSPGRKRRRSDGGNHGTAGQIPDADLSALRLRVLDRRMCRRAGTAGKRVPDAADPGEEGACEGA